MAKKNNGEESLIGSIVARNKTETLCAVAFVFIGLFLYSIYEGQDTAAAALVVGMLVILLIIYPGSFDSIRFGDVEVKLRQAQETLNEAKELMHLVAEIAIPLAHHTEGMASTAPATFKVKNLVLNRVWQAARDFDIEIDPAIKELDYYYTCSEYASTLHSLLYHEFREISGRKGEVGNAGRSLKHRIPASIDDVDSPDELRAAYEKNELMVGKLPELIDDYEYYFTHRKHRDNDFWNNRVNWSLDIQPSA